MNFREIFAGYRYWIGALLVLAFVSACGGRPTEAPPTALPTLTPTPVPPTATATQPPTLTPTPTPVAIPEPTGSILSIYLRGTNTETGFAALSGDQPNGGMIYEEGQCVYGDAAVQMGEEIYNFEKPLPDPWRVGFDFADELKNHITTVKGDGCAEGSPPDFNAKTAGFWVGILDDYSAMAAEDKPYSLTIKLYKGDELRERLQVFFTVVDVPELSPDGSGKPPYTPP